MNDDLETCLGEHAEQLTIIGEELDRQRTSLTARRSALSSRAALLIGAASIASGFHVAGQTNAWQVLAVAASLVSAMLGVVALWPRQGPDVNVDSFIDGLYRLGPHSTQLELINTKAVVHKQDEEALKGSGRVLRIGFVFLVLAVLFTGLQAAGVSVTLNL